MLPGTVKPAGGFAQTAGHAPFSSTYGLGADNVLEYKVVTADGKYVIANSKVNKQLYNALRGGGGGTFGVVIEATFKAHKSPRVIVRFLSPDTVSLKTDRTRLPDFTLRQPARMTPRAFLTQAPF
jgi:FAD/FMN-containing dehydrogenase